MRDLDLDAGKLSVAQTLVAPSYSLQFAEPKTDRSRRPIALDAMTAEALREHRDRQELDRALMGDAYADQDLVFANAEGSPINPHQFSQRFRRLKIDGVRRIPLRNLRHSYATLALRSGVHPKVVSEGLGHASVAFTLDTYTDSIRCLRRAPPSWSPLR